MGEFKIKRCPFCGGKSEVYKNRVWRYNVHCTVCGMGQNALSYETEEIAIEKWNTRKPIDELEENLKLLFQQCRSTKILRNSIYELIEKVGEVND